MKKILSLFLAASLSSFAIDAESVVPELPAEFTDGFFIQNEGWYGKAKGSINWVASDGTLFYNVDGKANGNAEVLGNTAQFGKIYGANYYVTSKQQPRFVVLDAKSLVRKATFDVLGSEDDNVGDGRDVCPVGNGKVYVGASMGIEVYDEATGAFVKSIEGTSTYEVGTIIRVGKYVFATEQNTGVLVIDPSTDAIVKRIENADITALVVSKDGNLWADAGDNLIRINPVTLEAESTFQMTNSLISAYTYPAKICASLTENALFYLYGSSWSANKIGKLLIDEDGNVSEDTNFSFTMPTMEDKYTPDFYGAPGFDPISGNLVVTTCNSYSINNWVHFVDPATGAVVKTIKLLSDDGKGTYWFMSTPVFPDNKLPEIELGDIALSGEEIAKYPVADFVSDADNLAALSIVEKAEIDDAEVATVDYDGMNIIVTPVGNGTANLSLSVNSNGKTAAKTVSVNVSGLSSVRENVVSGVDAYVSGGVLYVTGASEGVATVYNMMGAVVASAQLSGATAVDLSGVPAGTYIVKIRTANGEKSLKVAKF